MVYDRSITMYTLEGIPVKGTLTEHFRHYCAP